MSESEVTTNNMRTDPIAESSWPEWVFWHAEECTIEESIQGFVSIMGAKSRIWERGNSLHLHMYLDVQHVRESVIKGGCFCDTPVGQ